MHSRDLHDDERVREITVVASISQSFDVLVNKKSHLIRCCLPSMLFRYTLNGFLVWMPCIVNSICKVHKLLATRFYLFACQFGSDTFVLWGFYSCHLAYNSSFRVTRGRIILVLTCSENDGILFVCHTSGSEYWRSTQFRKLWQCSTWSCTIQIYETKKHFPLLICSLKNT